MHINDDCVAFRLSCFQLLSHACHQSPYATMLGQTCSSVVVVRGAFQSQCIGPMGQTCSSVVVVVVVRGDLLSQCIGPMGQTC